MSTTTPSLTPAMFPDLPSHSSTCPKPTRVLACVLCQERKVKCERKFPCKNCIRSGAQCVPATLAQRRRRRRFPERALLDRLSKYEDLLRRNNIAFEPLHEDPTRKKEPLNTGSGSDSGDEHPGTTGSDLPTASSTAKFERGYEAR